MFRHDRSNCTVSQNVYPFKHLTLQLKTLTPGLNETTETTCATGETLHVTVRRVYSGNQMYTNITHTTVLLRQYKT